jgi:hypothetical protein
MNIDKTLLKLLDILNFNYLEEIDYYLVEDSTMSKEEAQEFINEIGKFHFEEETFKKDGRSCIETRIIYFEKFDTYIKEIQIGPCHYKDVQIDGGADEIKYSQVVPKEVITRTFHELE